MNITLITVGKIKERFYQDAIKEYEKRLSKYCKLKIIEVPDEKTIDGASEHENSIVKDKEGDKILAKINSSDYVIALAINGKHYDSVGLSNHFKDLMTYKTSSIVLIIGGSLGLSNNVLNRADEKLSFSELTFPHQLMRVILLEQIYRSYRIMNNEPYHK